MGLGGAASVLPGVSAMGFSTSIASVCGVDRNYGLNMALMMNLFLTLGFIVHEIVGIAGNGAGTLSFMILLRYLFTALCAFAGTILGIKCMQRLAEEHGFAPFGLYCFGMALFTFILNLMA